MKTVWGSDPVHDMQPLLLWKRAGLYGFTFFLVKGLLWLVGPIMVYLIG